MLISDTIVEDDSLKMSASSQSSEGEEEPTALEYARRHGLAYDHLLESTCHLYSTLTLLGEVGDLMKDGDLPQFEFPEYTTDERLLMSKEAALLIAWASNNTVEIEAVYPGILSTTDQRSVKDKKLELPLLKSDHEIDCRRFAKRDGFDIKLEDVRLPFEMFDVENNDGIRIPDSLWIRSSELIIEIEKEKLGVTKEAIIYLQSALKVDWDENMEKEVWASVQKYKRVRLKPSLEDFCLQGLQTQALEPVTPPLSPIVSPVRSFEPEIFDPVFQIPLFSDPASLAAEDLERVEAIIFEEDVLTPIRTVMTDQGVSSGSPSTGDQIKMGMIYSPLSSMDDIASQPRLGLCGKRELLKAEETLTPPNLSPLSRTVHFSEIIEEMIFKSISSPDSETFDNEFIEEAFGDAGQRATRLTEQETLIAADAIGRVKVPILSFVLPDPPWKAFQDQQHHSELLLAQKNLLIHTIGSMTSRWPTSKLLDLHLKWNPFPHDLVHSMVEEDYNMDDETWKIIVNSPGDDDIINTSTMTWKPPGLRILRDSEEDDEIETGQFSNDVPQSFSYLIKKRKMEIEDRAELRQSNPQGSPGRPIQGVLQKHPLKKSLHPIQETPLQDYESNPGLLGSAFSLGASLDNHLEMRGTKKQKLAASSHFAKQDSVLKTRARTESSVQILARSSPINKPSPLPLPSIRHSEIPYKIIVSSSLLKNRALVRILETQLPGLTIIERDFTAHNTTAWMPNSVTRSPISSPLSSEADIIVSPSVGIILTTLQKIKQKPLPGQKHKPAVRDRVERVSARYEKLVVLVSGMSNDEFGSEMDEVDCRALSEFTGFTLGIDASITIQFVGGGEKTLSNWLARSIAHHNQGVGLELLDDETHWELFLRRAGINAYAAQAIIMNLKAPEGIDPQSHSKIGHFGLVAFVEMGWEQRVARFGKICGERVVKRVSNILEARWD